MVRNRSVFTQAEQDTIRDTAADILAQPSFRASERSSRLFRYLVDRALQQDDHMLKERRIGHEVFGREISYDTADDPIVRNAASDTRKRLRQYDAEHGSEQGVRILLGPGGYALDFIFSETVPPSEQLFMEDVAADSMLTTSSDRSTPTAIETPTKTSRLAWWIAALATIGCVFFAAAFFWQRHQIQASGFNDLAESSLWRPMLNSGKEIFICLGHAQSQADGLNQDTAVGMQRITLTDLKAYTNISGFLQLNRQSFQMRTDNQTTLEDLRDRPTVLIGIGNNQWTLRLTSNLRYHFDFSENSLGNPSRAVVIADSEHPEQRTWRVGASGTGASNVDYAIAGRLLDPVTGGLIVYVAGAGTVGTRAASEFVTQPRFLKSLPSSLNDPRTNIQIVIKTTIVGGVPGSPEVVATHLY